MADPVLVARISFDDASDTTPTWTDVSSKVRSFSIDRGRENELEETDAGTATVVLDDRLRYFDPTNVASPYYPNVVPMRRLWLQATFGGTTYDLFFGYIETWTESWPAPGDAVSTIQCTDAFKILAQVKLPSPDPPGEAYAETVMSDSPWGYWRLGETEGTAATTTTLGTWQGRGTLERAFSSGVVQALAGPALTYFNTPTLGTAGLVLGETDTAVNFSIAGTQYAEGAVDDPASLTGLTGEVTFEALVNMAAGNTPRYLAQYYYNAGTKYILLYVDTTDHLVFEITTTSGTKTATGSTALVAGTTYHVAGVFSLPGPFIRCYVNGVQDGTLATGSATLVAGTSTGLVALGGAAGSGWADSVIDEVAVYEKALPVARLLAHYQSARLRGYAQAKGGVRIGDILDASGFTITRDLDVGVRDILPVRQNGQTALEEIRRTRESEGGDSNVYVNGAGVIVFLDADHRGSSPHNTSQATFADDGTFVPYVNAELDNGDSFLFNEIRTTRIGGLTQTTTDATSKTKYLTRVLELSDLLVPTDGEAATIGTELLAKYKDPMTRIKRIEVIGASSVANVQILLRELGDKITVKRTPPGGGAVISQSSWIQSKHLEGDPYGPWRCSFAVSPL